MNKSLDEVKTRLEALSLKQQLIFLLVSFIAIYFIWDWLLFAPAEQRKLELDNKILGIQIQLTDLRNKINAAQPKSKQIKEFDIRKLALQTDKVVPMLRELMTKQPGLELVNISTKFHASSKSEDIVPGNISRKKVEELKSESEQEDGLSIDGAENNGIFKQVITLQFQGDYFSTLQFIERIESLPWILVHDRIVYKVINYPEANVTMQLTLLSLAQGLI